MNSKNESITENEPFRLDFTVEGPLSDFVFLELFDGEGKLMAGCYREISEILPKGLYQLHIYSSEKLETQVIRLDRDFSGVWYNKGSYSSISGYFLESSHEYYTETSKHWSNSYTVQPAETEKKTSLFIFFRYPDRETKDQQRHVAQSMGWRFSVLDASRKVILRLSEKNIQEDQEMGWLAFHAPLPSGMYYLLYSGPSKREIPLCIFEGWQTQFFLTFKRTPIFPTARINLRNPNTPFEKLEHDNMEVDKLLTNIENSIYHIPSAIIKKVASGDWENPMLAIVVCYIYLLNQEKNDNERFAAILENLKNRLPEASHSADILAIQLLSEVHYNKKIISEYVLEEPCMLKVGFKAFIQQAALHPDRVKMEGLNEIIQTLQDDTVWTSYQPVPQRKKNTHHIKTASIKMNVMGRDRVKVPKDWLSQSMISQLCVDRRKNTTVGNLALQFQISPDMVKNCLEKLEYALAEDENVFSENNAQSTKVLKSNISRIVSSFTD